jgi:thimet oligopeptidase
MAFPRVRLTLAGVASLLAASLAQAATLPGPAFPLFSSAEQVESVCTASLTAARQRVQALEASRVDAGWLARFDDLSAFFEDAQGPVDFMQYVHPDKAVRDAAQACSLKWAELSSAIAQSEKLYRGLRKAPAQGAIDKELVRLSQGQFEDAGVSLAGPKRERARQIRERLVALDQDFQKNIRDANTRLPFTEAELRGVPAGVWAKATRDDQGRVLLGLDTPTYMPLVQLAEDASARERMWRARWDQGGDANLKLLGEIAALRAEYAGLFGFKTYVDFNLRRRMAKDGKTASAFLSSVGTAVQARERAEIDELRAAKAAHLGAPLASTVLNRWDVEFYSERLRQSKYKVEQEAFRPYFPSEHALPFVMRVIEKLMGVSFTKVEVPLWHAEAQAYLVADKASGKPMAQLYVDLYPRDGKYNHAAVWPLRGSATRLQRTPTAALVVNNDRKGLSLQEMETLLHEFGHAVHVTLSNTRHVGQAGTSVMLDFVEAPSQMLEDWVYDPRVLKLMQEVCASCPPVPAEMLDKARAARHFGKGLFFGRQQLFASFDLALHSTAKPDPMALWAKMEGATPLGHVAGVRLPAGFAHLSGGYGAGYYAYLWSLVQAVDMRTAFAADKLDPAVGARYRERVLAQGSQKPAPQLVQDFLGRPSNSQAFFEDLKR